MSILKTIYPFMYVDLHGNYRKECAHICYRLTDFHTRVPEKVGKNEEPGDEIEAVPKQRHAACHNVSPQRLAIHVKHRDQGRKGQGCREKPKVAATLRYDGRIFLKKRNYLRCKDQGGYAGYNQKYGARYDARFKGLFDPSVLPRSKCITQIGW